MLLAACVGQTTEDSGTEAGGLRVSPNEPAGTATPSTPAKVRSDNLLGTLTNGLTNGVGDLTGALGLCAPLTCCFPSGGGWTADPFEQELKALGCTTPAAYTESAGASEWWLYTQCPASDPLQAAISAYSAPPYDAQIVVNVCLALGAVTSLDLNAVFVEFDPTCNSCRPHE
jgi:hypothetical protein